MIPAGTAVTVYGSVRLGCIPDSIVRPPSPPPIHHGLPPPPRVPCCSSLLPGTSIQSSALAVCSESRLWSVYSPPPPDGVPIAGLVVVEALTSVADTELRCWPQAPPRPTKYGPCARALSCCGLHVDSAVGAWWGWGEELVEVGGFFLAEEG